MQDARPTCGEVERGVERKVGLGAEHWLEASCSFGEERGKQLGEGDSRGKEGMNG
jgi:hypothetical protein